MEIKQYFNFLSQEQHSYVIDHTLKSNRWEFSGHSRENEAGFVFWNLSLDNNKFFTKKLLKKINKKTNQNFLLERVYANGQTYGLCGLMHYDKINGNNKYFTFLYYANPIWKPNWGGQTVFFDKNNNAIFSQYPAPNLGILFNSEILHAGLEPSRLCTELRVSIAFKLKLSE